MVPGSMVPGSMVSVSTQSCAGEPESVAQDTVWAVTSQM